MTKTPTAYSCVLNWPQCGVYNMALQYWLYDSVACLYENKYAWCKSPAHSLLQAFKIFASHDERGRIHLKKAIFASFIFLESLSYALFLLHESIVTLVVVMLHGMQVFTLTSLDLNPSHITMMIVIIFEEQSYKKWSHFRNLYMKEILKSQTLKSIQHMAIVFKKQWLCDSLTMKKGNQSYTVPDNRSADDF